MVVFWGQSLVLSYIPFSCKNDFISARLSRQFYYFGVIPKVEKNFLGTPGRLSLYPPVHSRAGGNGPYFWRRQVQ